MEEVIQIDSNFIEKNTHFIELIQELKYYFSKNKVIVPMRHRHDFPNPEVNADSTLLLMPAWNPSKNAGVKIITVSPKNGQFNLPAIQGVLSHLLKLSIKF